MGGRVGLEVPHGLMVAESFFCPSLSAGISGLARAALGMVSPATAELTALARPFS